MKMAIEELRRLPSFLAISNQNRARGMILIYYESFAMPAKSSGSGCRLITCWKERNRRATVFR